MLAVRMHACWEAFVRLLTQTCMPYSHIAPTLQGADTPTNAASSPLPKRPRFYLSVRTKFTIALAASVLWAIGAAWMAQRWVEDLSALCGPTLAYLTIYGIAVIPGFMNAFLVVSLILDRRPRFLQQTLQHELPPITILVAAYNEADNILGTLESIDRQHYPGYLRVIVVNDGSSDHTLSRLRSVHYPWLQVIDMGRNVGKARALTHALGFVRTKLTLTVDGDSYLYKNALANIVRRYLSDPTNTKAVAGAVLVRNSRKNLVTRIQEWDYFHGIAAIKRLQSLYQGTLVAQGAFSLYDTQTLRELGGWPPYRGRGHRAHLGYFESRTPRRLCGKCLPVHQCTRHLEAVHSPAPALVPWTD